jgi:hypothetical protein
VLIAPLLWHAAPPIDAIASLTAKAVKGDARAQAELGRRHLVGEGVAKDDAAALRWFRKAALAGEPTAQYHLGLAAVHGRGVPKDEAAAAVWFRLAGGQGHAPAQLAWGSLCEQGKGVARSDLKAFVLYSLAGRADGAKKARDRLAAKLSTEQLADARRLVAAAEALVAVHPRRFGTAANVEKVRGWYVWRKFDRDSWRAEVARESDGQVFQVRVLPWATTYRHLNYGVRPDELLPGERVNVFFAADEDHARGYVTHFQDEIGQMKGHGHAWKVRSVSDGRFVAVAVAGDKPLDGKELTFDLDPKCRVWKAGKVVKAMPYAAGDRVLMTWVLRDRKRIAVLVTDDASLKALEKEQAERLDKKIAAEGVAGQVQTVEDGVVHVMVFATHWSQAGRLKEKQTVRLRPSGKGLRPEGEGVAAEVLFRKNRGVYGSGPTDVLLRLKDAKDADKVRGWSGVVRLAAGS